MPTTSMQRLLLNNGEATQLTHVAMDTLSFEYTIHPDELLQACQSIDFFNGCPIFK